MNFFQTLSGLLESQAAFAALHGFVSSFLFCVLLVMTKRWHGIFTMDHTDGVQKFHTAPTPRVGGISILLGAIIAWDQVPTDVREMLTPILFAGLPAFIFGIAEDMTRRVGVSQRLLATMASGLLAWWITDYSLTRVDIPGVDWFLSFTLLSVIFTAFAAGGVANSINIIDGFNGLAGTASTLAFIGYGMIAWQVGDQTLVGVCLVMAACVFGFLLVNWPMGKIFLGDGGSYFVGFSLAWVAVLLLERHPHVSAFAALLVCAHPVIEVLFSMFRRMVKKQHAGHPDRLHLHSLVKQRYVRRWFPYFPDDFDNSITGMLVGLMTLPAIIAANLFFDSAWMSATAFAVFSLGYVTLFARMARFRWHSPLAFIFLKPKATN